MGRAPCCEKVGLKKGRWTAEEDEILTKYIQANGEGSWRSLPKNAGLLRCGKSCRLRWINYLRADLKRGNFSAEEEDIIMKLHAAFGNRWSWIASHLTGRTDNEIKNYWNSHLSRKIYSFRRGAINGSTDTSTHKISVTVPPKRKGGRTSRWAMVKKSNAQKDTEKPKQSVTVTNQKDNNEAIPLPPTPAPESESLSSAITDFILEPDTEDLADFDGPISHKENNINCNFHDREGGKNENSIDSMLCVGDGEKEITIHINVEQGVNVGGVLSFNDIVDSDTCLVETGGVKRDVVGVGDGENERGVACPNEMVTRREDQNSNGEWYSCSSVASGLDFDDDNWDWERVMQLNNYDDYGSVSWEHGHSENLLTWLCEDDDWENYSQQVGDIDPEKQNAMLAWFSS